MLIKSVDGTQLGGVATTREDKIRIQNYLDKLETRPEMRTSAKESVRCYTS